MNVKTLSALLALLASFAVVRVHAADCGCCASLAATADHPGSVPVLLGLDPVRKELKLAAAQTARLDKIRAAFKADARKLAASMPQGPAARRSAAANLAVLKTAADANALAVLTPAQRSRFVQIEHQVLGGTMLVSPSVQKSLGLSAPQIARISKLRQAGLASAATVNRRFNSGEISHHERMAILRSCRIKEAAAMLQILTPPQKQVLNSLRGKPVASH